MGESINNVFLNGPSQEQAADAAPAYRSGLMGCHRKKMDGSPFLEDGRRRGNAGQGGGRLCRACRC